MRHFFYFFSILLCVAVAEQIENPADESIVASQVSDYEVERLMESIVTAPTEQYKGIVKVEVDTLIWDYTIPWQVRGYSSGIGSAFLVGKKSFMTNAHVVSNAKRIYISQHGDSRKIPARVKYIAHDADLALLEVDDFEQFENLPYLEFSKELPRLEDEVRAIGYPVGGGRISVTRGVVSRIDFIHYVHSGDQAHLAIQVDAAINPGNSGGPVLMGDKVIGVAFQAMNNAKGTGYVIPYPVIERFLKDVKDGKYDSYVELGVGLYPIINPVMRQALKLDNDEKGVFVGSIVRGTVADGVLQLGDVLLEVDGYDVDSSGMIDLNGEKVKVEELVERCFAGDKLSMKIVRKGEKKRLTVELKTWPYLNPMSIEYEKRPRYVVFGGLLFQPLQYNVIAAHEIPRSIYALEFDRFLKGEVKNKEEIVLISNILADEINAQQPDMSGGVIVEKVNGVVVKGLSHLYELLYGKEKSNDPFVVIEVKGDALPFVFEREAIGKSNDRIAREYNISSNACLDGNE